MKRSIREDIIALCDLYNDNDTIHAVSLAYRDGVISQGEFESFILWIAVYGFA